MDKDPRTYGIIGAAMTVHRKLGSGCLESVYREALQIQLQRHAIPHRCEVPLPVWYDGVRLKQGFRADFLCHEAIIVELKAIETLGRREVGQLANYLAITGVPLGLLLNFGASELQFQRVIGKHAEPRRHVEEDIAGYHPANHPEARLRSPEVLLPARDL